MAWQSPETKKKIGRCSEGRVPHANDGAAAQEIAAKLCRTCLFPRPGGHQCDHLIGLYLQFNEVIAASSSFVGPL
jgi:hypothetical protein